MILMALMWTQIPSDPDNFKRIIKYQTLRTSFCGGFESVDQFWMETIYSYHTVAIIKGN